MREWHNRKNTYELKDMHISEAVTYTMHFGLFGPHPYMNPLEAIIDAFQFYEENRRFEKDMAKDVIKKLAKAYGMTVKIDD